MPDYNSPRRPGAFRARENPNSTDSNRSLAARWGSNLLFKEGYVAVPAPLLRLYTRLNLSNSEFVFILELMLFKWGEQAPFPSYKTVAQRMGITIEMARKHAKSLEEKGLLKRVKRTGQSNAFDLQPLTTMLESLLAEKPVVGREAA
jgi:hypothetical protein